MENTNLITEEEFGVYYTYAMKQAIRKINSGRRVHLKTLKKLNLLHFLEIEGVKARVIFPKDYTEEEVPTPYPKPVFTKQDVIDMALSGRLYPPKTTRHRIADYLPPIHISLEKLSLLSPTTSEESE